MTEDRGLNRLKDRDRAWTRARTQRETGGMAGEPISGLGSRPSGAWFGRSGSGAGFSTQPSIQPSTQSSLIDSAICHLPSIQSSNHFRWQVAAPGGRWRDFCPPSSIQSSVIDSALHSALNAVLYSVLPDRFSHPSSAIDSVICHRFSPPRSPPFSPPWSTAAARSARSADPTSSQCPEITKKRRTKNQEQSRFLPPPLPLPLPLPPPSFPCQPPAHGPTP